MAPWVQGGFVHLGSVINALCEGHVSCGAISEEPCADLVLHWGQVIMFPMWHLGVP